MIITYISGRFYILLRLFELFVTSTQGGSNCNMHSFLKKIPQLKLLNFTWQKRLYVFNQTRLLSVISPTEIHEPEKLRGRLASNEQKRIITEFVTESNSSKLNWNALKTNVLAINRGYINEKNINGIILETCSKQKRLDLAKSYMNYVKECGQTKPNLSLELLYIRSCYVSRDQLSDKDQHEIQAICNSLLKRNSHLLNNVLEGLVLGLCCTPAWRDSLEHVNAIKNENDVTVNSLISIALRAFEEEEIDLGWALTQTIFTRHKILSFEIFSAWFNICEKNSNFRCLKVLEFLRDNECVLRTDMAELIHEKLNQFGYEVTTTMIHYSTGECKNCNHILKPVKIIESEFNKLQDCFMSNVMIGNNIFNNTSPQELNNFKDFIETTAPYDVVIDGLNLAYAYRGQIANNSLTKVVMKTFIEKKLKILLIGRKHLVQMLGKEFNFIRKNSHIFFTNDLSKDDPFVLYAAMYSGLGTKILTRDLMRSHKFLLRDAKIKSIFQKWLQIHRLVLKIRPGNKVAIKDPILHLQVTQELADGIWHLPFNEFKEPGSWSKPDSSPDNWMCIQT